jgi:hypothetical protein
MTRSLSSSISMALCAVPAALGLFAAPVLFAVFFAAPAFVGLRPQACRVFDLNGIK